MKLAIYGKIDVIDTRLLRELQKNAKLTTKELGDRINLSSIANLRTSEATGA